MCRMHFLAVLFLASCAVSSGFLQTEEFLAHDKSVLNNQMKLSVSNNYRDMMTVYEPMWLAALWPKLRNGAHLTLEPRCWGNLTVFFQDMLDGRAWALSAIDSTGSFGSGLLWGNRFWIGSQEQCNDLDNRFIDLVTNSSSHALSHIKYISSLNRHGENTGPQNYRGDILNREILARMILLDNTPPYRMGYSAVTLHLNITKTTLFSSHLLLLGACLPRACRSPDIHELLDFSIKSYQSLRVSGTLPRAARVLRVRFMDQEYSVYDDTKFYILSSITLFLIVLIMTGTVVEINADNSVEVDLDLSPPTFKSFIKSDPAESIINSQESEKSIDFNTNMDDIDRSIQMLKMSKMLKLGSMKSTESIHTIDGLIPNKYTEIVSGIFPNSDTITVNSLNKRGQVNLVTVKNVIKKDSAPTITVDIIAMKGDNSSSTVTTLSENRNGFKRQKYVISMEEPSQLTKLKCRIKNINFLNCVTYIDRNSSLAKVLMCFSLKTNLGKIFCTDVGEDTLAPIHGIKVISLLWVILVHTCLVVFQLSDNKVSRGKIETNFFYQTISNGTYSVDTFFVLSGLLVSYLYCQSMKKYSTDHLRIGRGVFGKVVQYVGIMIHRYIRLTPPYLLTLGLLEISSRYFNSHSVLELPGKDHVNCNRYWWRNALYVNTFYPLRETCMSWSWYLANDTLFYAVGILVLMMSMRHIKFAALFVVVFLLTGWSTTAMVTLRTGYIPSIENPLSHYDDIYDKPWTRVGPYLAGLGAGWALSKVNCCLLISKSMSFSLWAISLSTLVSIVFGLYGSDLGMYGSVAYVTLSHSAWGLAVAWVVVACVTGYGGAVNSILSCRYLYPLSRLSYCTYLLHPMILKALFISAGAVLHLSPEAILINFLGFTVISFAAGLVVSVIFEAPAVSLLRLVNPLKRYSEHSDL